MLADRVRLSGRHQERPVESKSLEYEKLRGQVNLPRIPWCKTMGREGVSSLDEDGNTVLQ